MKNNQNNYSSKQPSVDVIIDKIIQTHILSAWVVAAHVKIAFSIYPKETWNNCRHIKAFVPEYDRNFKNNSNYCKNMQVNDDIM